MYSTDVTSDTGENEVSVSSFYTKKKYLTPLERKKLKRYHSEIQPSPPLSETKSKKKSKSLPGKSSLKENRESPKPKPKSNIGMVSENINPSVFLTKKDAPSSGTKKFFKSRVSNELRDQLSSTFTYKSIVPVDIKAANALVQDRRRHIQEKKVNRTVLSPIIHHMNVQDKSSSELVNETDDKYHSSPSKKEIPLKKTGMAACKWIKSSFHHEDAGLKQAGNSEEIIEVSSSSYMNCRSHTKANAGEDSPDHAVADDVMEEPVSPRQGNRPVIEAKKFYSVFQQQKSMKLALIETNKTTTRDPKKNKHFCVEDKDQMMIDAGQSQIGAKQCSTCSMIYHIANDQDEDLHKKFHLSYLANLKFPGWKKEKVIGNFIDGRVIMVNEEDPKFMLKKVEDVLTIVNRDLGFADTGIPTRPDVTILLFVSLESKVIGCLVAESISSAYLVYFDEESEDLVPVDDFVASEDLEEGKVKAVCGINRLWVAPSSRGDRIATRMVDCLRCNFYYGYLITNEDLAYLDPSNSGRKFASKYSDNGKFLVYK